jgi:DNA-binding NarL/FixJ family response regulator
MDRSPVDFYADDCAPAGRIPGLAPPTQFPQANGGAASFRALLAHRHGLFSQGLAALLAGQPGIALVAQVADGEAAWEAIRTRTPEVALLDLDLDQVSGTQVLERVRAAGLTTRCLILAGADDPSLVSRTLAAGAAGWLRKDSGFEELLFALQTIHAGGTFISPPLAAKPRDPRAEGPSLLDLSAREREVLRLVAAGNTSKAIARVLGISCQTVETHRRRLMKKLDLHCAAQVVSFAARAGMLA